MDKVSVKIVVAGRSYPLTINKEEEEAVQKAANDINTNIQKLQANYAVKDMQDLLAMTALQLATRTKVADSLASFNQEEWKKKVLTALNTLSDSLEIE